MDDADQPEPPDQATRTPGRRPDRLPEAHARPPAPLPAADRSGTARGGAAAARAAARVRLNAEGHRLHAEDLRLRTERGNRPAGEHRTGVQCRQHRPER